LFCDTFSAYQSVTQEGPFTVTWVLTKIVGTIAAGGNLRLDR